MINEPIISLCGEPAGFYSIYRNNESAPYIGEGVGSTIDLKWLLPPNQPHLQNNTVTLDP